MSRYTVDGRKGPFTEAIFPAVFVASPNCLCKLAVILWRLRADLAPQNCRDCRVPPRPKKGESSKESKKTWSPSGQECLTSCWAQADCLFNTSHIRWTSQLNPDFLPATFFCRRQRITERIPKHATLLFVAICCMIGDMVLLCLVLTSHALSASR